MPLAALPARAADGSEQNAATLRSQADAIATGYFDALARYETLDREITHTKQQIAALAKRARRARTEARERAVSVYRTSSAQLPSVLHSDDAVVAARRVRLIDSVNSRTRVVFTRLRTSTKALKTRRRALEAARKEQADALDALREQGAAMESKLALAQQQEQAALVVAAQPAAQPAAESVDAATTTTIAAPLETTAPPPTTLPTTTTTLPKVVNPVPPPNYVGTPGVYVHHDDPFLTCVRTRESGGNYSAVNPAGPWLGAYQFLQSTWNASANHGGLTKLVGVPANLATQYDQDNVAWVLYQWQGAAPWGGACP